MPYEGRSTRGILCLSGRISYLNRHETPHDLASQVCWAEEFDEIWNDFDKREIWSTFIMLIYEWVVYWSGRWMGFYGLQDAVFIIIEKKFIVKNDFAVRMVGTEEKKDTKMESYTVKNMPTSSRIWISKRVSKEKERKGKKMQEISIAYAMISARGRIGSILKKSNGYGTEPIPCSAASVWAPREEARQTQREDIIKSGDQASEYDERED
ncbi:hypothetical protein EV421DRAFT_1742301 [Armillaria borealis]|uniref:Uncharacterized protein n=1 Tax=Armillaria borealis TaxID=47425 RepID=A0AA39MG37_9AGAR|nr:hypothetical protein EV421DRAFT_1742301 [Armillaria borealis]